MDNQAYMHLAIEEARKNIGTETGGPFGACIVKEGKVIGVARNTVLQNDATCHAEINAIRIASQALQSYDLSGCEIYSTTEPCPMCFSAIHWARIGKVYFGTSIDDVYRLGFNELRIPNVIMKELGRSRIKIEAGLLQKECMALLQDWARGSSPHTY